MRQFGKCCTLKRRPGRSPYELRTAAVLYKALKRKSVDLANISVKDLHRQRDLYTDVPGMKQLDQRIDITQVLSEEPVFQIYNAQEHDFLQCNTSMPKRQCQAPNVEQWWTYIENAEEHIMNGGSVFIHGHCGHWENHTCPKHHRTNDVSWVRNA